MSRPNVMRVHQYTGTTVCINLIVYGRYINPSLYHKSR